MTLSHAQRLRQLLGNSKAPPSDAELLCDPHHCRPRQIAEILVLLDFGAPPGSRFPHLFRSASSGEVRAVSAFHKAQE